MDGFSKGPNSSNESVGDMTSPTPRGAHVLVGVTGSVAALKLPLLVSGLLQIPQVEVQVVSTERAKHFYNVQEISVPVYSDEDEWKMWTQRSDPVLHIELRRWADLLLIAPLDANTLGKISSGICDTLLTCVVRAWDLQKPLLFCPAMNTAMWNNPITAEQIERLSTFGYMEIACIEKTLVCGDKGRGYKGARSRSPGTATRNMLQSGSGDRKADLKVADLQYSVDGLGKCTANVEVVRDEFTGLGAMAEVGTILEKVREVLSKYQLQG